MKKNASQKSGRNARASASSEGPAAEWIATAELREWPDNPRMNDDNVARVAASIRRFGFGAPLVARREGLEIIAGHTRWRAAQMLGLERVPVRLMDLPERDAHILALADNRLTELSPWAVPELQQLLSEYDLSDVEIAGWTSKDLEKMASDLLKGAGQEGEVTEDEVPEPPAQPVTVQGDVWELGPHRLVCGDCRDPAVMRVLLAGVRVNVGFTSPPYASQRAYDESSGFKPIAADDYVAWFEAVQANVRSALAPDGSWFVNIKPHSDGLDTSLYVLDLVLAHVRQWRWHFATEYAWARIGMPGKPARRFKNQFEPVYQFALAEWKFRPEQVMHELDSVPTYSQKNHWAHGLTDGTAGRSGKGWAQVDAGHAYPGNLLDRGSTQTHGGHIAAFPVSLPSFFIRAYSDAGDAILDPFMGSGTTLIAAAQLERVAYGVDISPAYCDVIVERWQALTGGKAVRRGR